MFEENKWNEMDREDETMRTSVEEDMARQEPVRSSEPVSGNENRSRIQADSEQNIQNGQTAGESSAPGRNPYYSQNQMAGQGQPGNQNQPMGQNQPSGQGYPYGQGNWQNGSVQPSGYQSQGNPQQSGQNPNGYQNQQGMGRNPYSSPYPYGNYQSQGPAGNGGGNGVNGGAPMGGGHKQPRKKSYMRTTALVTASALLFGVIAGGTMFGVNRAASLVFPQPASSQSTLENTPTVPAAQASSSQTSSGTVIEDVSAIVEAAMPSVVAITNTMLYKSNTWFGQTQTYEIPSSGSGIIVGQNDSELLIVTNNHVVEDAASLQVTFVDESTVEAAIKGTDSASDLAVIAIPLDTISADTKTKIKAATLGDSDALKMGQGVIAIGNALGHGQSVTVGHVSALNREIQVDGVTKTVIQTDAAINPGNSGGALLNANGELIGINEAKYASTEVEGVGYAIPISFARDIIDDLKSRTTKIEVAEEEQGYLGIQVQNIDSATSKMYGMPQGVYVYKIMEDSAAAGSDLREKDIITKFDGETVRSNGDLTNLLTYYKAGSTVTLTVQSLENGQYVERQVQVTLKNRPQEENQSGGQENGQGNSQGNQG